MPYEDIAERVLPSSIGEVTAVNLTCSLEI